jgi:hypothetical protein
MGRNVRLVRVQLLVVVVVRGVLLRRMVRLHVLIHFKKVKKIVGMITVVVERLFYVSLVVLVLFAVRRLVLFALIIGEVIFVVNMGSGVVVGL